MGRLRKAAMVAILVVAGTGASQALRAEEPAAALPDACRGFKGLLLGTLVSKGEWQFVLKVNHVAAVWPQSKAESPEGLVGKEVPISVRRRGPLVDQQFGALARLRPGDPVLVEAFHLDGNSLTVVELLRKAGDPTAVGESQPGGHHEPVVPREGGGEHGHGDKLIPREGGGEHGHGDKLVPREGGGEHGHGDILVPRPAQPGAGEAPVQLEGITGGFKSLVVGTLVSKGEEDFTLKVDKVSAGPNASEAERAERLNGQEVKITVRRDGIVRPRLAEALAGLKAGDRAIVGVQHLEGKTYAVVSVLRRADENPGGTTRKEGEGAERRDNALASAEVLDGFRGILQGTIQTKGEDRIVLRVEKVAKVWQSSQSKNPEALVGKCVQIIVPVREAGLTAALATLKEGDRVTAGAVHGGGARLTATEMLKKSEAE